VDHCQTCCGSSSCSACCSCETVWSAQPRKGHKNEANELKIAVEKLVIPVTFAMQDQKVNNETVNAEQSLTLVRNLIRVTISQIAYIRNIFPSKCFEECQLF
jgi:hypothetical protein